jgi:hypothetical protein
VSREKNQSGLSVRTLAIASAASLTAAVVVREIWGPGAIIGAAMTPVIVALVSESLSRPTERITSIASERRTRTRVHQRTPSGTEIAPPPELERPDPFGIWEEDKPRRLDSRHLKIAIATGLAAFALVVVLLTSSELVFGGSVTGGSKTTVFGGKKKKSSSEEKTNTSTSTTSTETTPSDTETAPTETTPAETTPTTPTTETPAPQGETVPPTTTPTPTTTTPPAGGEQAPPG